MTEQSLFIAALELTAHERSALLDTSCADQPELRRRIERLLSVHDSAGDFMSQPALTPEPDLPASVFPVGQVPAPGMQIGPYRLLEQLGEGGMGTVFRAEQFEPVHRIAALKVIRPGLDSKQIIGRFEAERQALALMEHPNIARVLDAGTTDSGRPYFVMELVQGVPITRYCDEHRLTPRQRLELFVPVCLAVQHAHQKGIIHRDLKPSNVLVALVDGAPVAKVIDFGVAKAAGPALTEQTLHTAIGQLIGTLEYMSPEQAQLSDLDVDTRSDVYSLGVLLYELLVGSTPIAKERLAEAPLMEVLRTIREDEPLPPSQRMAATEALPTIAANRGVDPRKLAGLLRGELDWVVMKALEKHRSRRYESASNLALDLQRYLHDEPVQACPPSAFYRIGKLARRHRVALSSAVLVLATMIVGIVVSATQAIRATRSESRAQESLLAEKKASIEAETARQAEAAERQIAETNRAEAETMRAQAQANLNRARRAVDDMYTQIAEKWLVNQPQMQTKQREFLQKALQYYAEFAEESGRDPAVRLETADAYRRVAEIQHKLGEPAQADDAFRKSIDKLQGLADEFTERPLYRQKLADALHHYGVLLSDTGRFEEQATVHRRALALQQQLAAEFPGDRNFRSDLGRGYWFLGSLHDSGMPCAEAERAFRSAQEIQTGLVAEYPSIPEYRQQLAQTYRGLSRALACSTSDEDRKVLQLAAAILERLVADFPEVPGYRNELGDIYYHLALRAVTSERESLLHKALDLQEQLASEYPSVTDYRYDLCRTYTSLGQHAHVPGRESESDQAFQRAIEIGKKLVADAEAVHYYRGRLAMAYAGYADLLSATGRTQEAQAALQRSIEIHEALLADFPSVHQYPPRLVFSLISLGEILAELGRSAEARVQYEKAFAINPNSPAALRRLARALAESPDSDPNDVIRAVELAKRLVQLCPRDPECATTLGLACYRAGDWPAAAAALRKAIDLHPGECPAMTGFLLAMTLWQTGEPEKARIWRDRADASIGQRRLKPDEKQIKAEAEQLLKAMPAPQ